MFIAPDFQRCHFEFSARVIKDNFCGDTLPEDIIRAFARELASTNTNFNREKFIAAATK